jgi:RNA polymerase sigma factor (sigma-70 family)
VRNTCYTWLQQNRKLSDVLNENITLPNPETLPVRNIDLKLLRKALEELPIEFREVMILRELEGMSYKEIAAIACVPLETVMSRLAHARDRLQSKLARETRKRSLA